MINERYKVVFEDTGECLGPYTKQRAQDVLWEAYEDEQWFNQSDYEREEARAQFIVFDRIDGVGYLSFVE